MPAGAESYTLSAAEVAVVRAAVRNAISGGNSAVFPGVFAATRQADGSVAVCGYVNAGNSAIDFTTAKPFLGTFLDGAFEIFIIGGIDIQSQLVTITCKERGVDIRPPETP
jgi:hypothetical protein